MDGIKRVRSLAPVAGAVALAVSSIAALPTSGLSAATPNCSAKTAGAPMQITGQCVDPQFNRGVIDVDEWRDAPVRQRKGLQPVVELRVNAGERADVALGQTVGFAATIEAAPGTGKIVAAEWDFEGAGNYPVPITYAPAESAVILQATHAYSKPGTTLLCCERRRSGTAMRRHRTRVFRISRA